jgi:hypothetical protein
MSWQNYPYNFPWDLPEHPQADAHRSWFTTADVIPFFTHWLTCSECQDIWNEPFNHSGTPKEISA